jgi:hypothetical protein
MIFDQAAFVHCSMRSSMAARLVLLQPTGQPKSWLGSSIAKEFAP